MLEVLILETNQSFQTKLKTFIHNLTLFEELQLNVISGLDKVHPQEQGLEMLILLALNTADDLNQAKSIHQKMPKANLILYSANKQLLYQGIHQHLCPLDCIQKSINTSAFFSAIRQNILFVSQNPLSQMPKDSFYYCKVENKIVPIALSEIYYFKLINSNTLQLVFKQGNLRCNGTLKEIENLNLTQFFRCHRSYILNLPSISFIDLVERKCFFDFSKKDYCPISTRKIGYLKQYFSKKA